MTRREATSRVPLSKERIVAAAFGLVDEFGLPGLTIRRLGETLGCEAMSLYHHFPSKQHLHDAMVEHALAGIREPDPDLDPIARLRFIGREYRAMAHRYPKFFPLLALHRLDMPSGVAFVERMLRHFRVALPDDRLAAQAFRIFGHYVIGAALDETARLRGGTVGSGTGRRRHDCAGKPAARPVGALLQGPVLRIDVRARLRDDA